jgi:hypothetical protein
MTEAEQWLAAQPKNSKGKVDITVVIAEGRKRGYCICPIPMRQMISFDGLIHQWCGMPDTNQSWEFWYKKL